jgi:hypothetical protein
MSNLESLFARILRPCILLMSYMVHLVLQNSHPLGHHALYKHTCQQLVVPAVALAAVEAVAPVAVEVVAPVVPAAVPVALAAAQEAEQAAAQEAPAPYKQRRTQKR